MEHFNCYKGCKGALPMEGVDFKAFNEEFALREKTLHLWG